MEVFDVGDGGYGCFCWGNGWDVRLVCVMVCGIVFRWCLKIFLVVGGSVCLVSL